MFVLLLVLLASCATSIPSRVGPNPNLIYEKDLKVAVYHYKVDSWRGPVEFTGIGVVPKARDYSIRVYPKANVDLLSLTSCHREWKSEDPKKVRDGVFKRGYYEFQIQTSEELEAVSSCPISLAAFDKQS